MLWRMYHVVGFNILLVDHWSYKGRIYFFYNGSVFSLKSGMYLALGLWTGIYLTVAAYTLLHKAADAPAAK